ncbi:MAG: DUF4097 family beta strand repeat-containing protein [Planctomycetota bacterium]
MLFRTTILKSAFLVFALSHTGCIIVGQGSGMWTETQTEVLNLDPANLRNLEVQTQNGSIEFSGRNDQPSTATVKVTKKVSSGRFSSADDALNAIEVFVEPAHDGTQRVGWRWREPRHSSWSACVDFAITTPEQVNLTAVSHNGEIKVCGARGETNITTHNGEINVQSTDGKLVAETHNGRISAKYQGSSIGLVSHNGRVSVDLSKCGDVGGEVMTYNGAVDVVVSDQTSANLSCKTHNGRVTIDGTFNATTSGKSHAEGKLGAGGKPLEVSTHNGAIRFKKVSG